MKNERDTFVDRLLAGTLKARAGMPPDAGCLSAETLGAWADDALDARERASAEAHAADCARCQELLAAMVRTLPPPIVTKWSWRMPALGWLVPLTAAATALVIWVAVPKPAPVQVSEITPAVDQVGPSRVSAPLSAPLADAKAKVQTEAGPGQVASERDLTAPEPPSTALRERRDVGALQKQAAPTPSPPARADALSEAVTTSPAASVAGAAPAPALAPAAAPRSADSSLRERV
jgi:Putative zinc-finger